LVERESVNERSSKKRGSEKKLLEGLLRVTGVEEPELVVLC